jgi:hypothetical protein
VSYTEKYGDLWRKKRSFTAFVHGSRIRRNTDRVRSLTSVYALRICRPGYEPYISQTIAVRKIPENVTANDLKNLFGNCYVETFCPAQCINQGSRTKTLLG